MEIVSMVRVCRICGAQERLHPLNGKPTYGVWRPELVATAGSRDEWVRRNLPRAVKAHPAGEAGILGEAWTGAANLRACLEGSAFIAPSFAKVAAVVERLLGVTPDLRPGRAGRSVEAHAHRFDPVGVAPAERTAAGVEEFRVVHER